MKTRLVSTCTAIALVLGSAIVLAAAKKPSPATNTGGEVPFEISRIYWEYNASANDLGVHVSLDGEDWRTLKISRPNGSVIFEAEGRGPYRELGMTELFFEGAEPSLDEFALQELLAMFPQGEYEFDGRTVDGEEIEGTAQFSHAIPAGPQVTAQVGPGNLVRILWSPVMSPPPGFPNLPIHISGYQVIVGTFQVTLPPAATSVTLPPEFVASLASGLQPFEVLAIEDGGNQTIAEGSFVK